MVQPAVFSRYCLYKAKAEGVPMTVLANRLVEEALGTRNGVTNDVEEEHVGDLQFNFFFNLGGHVVKLGENAAIDNCALA
jgi:hypothetical protein